MYVSRSEVAVVAEAQRDFIAANEAMLSGMRDMAGFRWAMLLRSLDNPEKLASIAMWLTRDQAEAWAESDSGVLHYDVATARGAMTPAAFAAIVDWQVDPASSPDFVNRWNAAFHAIEDRLGSRLLQDLGQPESYAGLHVANQQADLEPGVLAAEIVSGGQRLQPGAIDRFEVALLTEA